MFKKLLKAGMTFALLWGCYVAYGHAFEFVVLQFRTYRSKENLSGFEIHLSRSKQHAIALAKQSFGIDHWSVTNDQPYAYYSSERGFWMYTLDVEEIQEENGVRYDGKRMKMKPFAMIFESSDGKKHQTLTADRATLDMNQPVGLSSGRQGTEAMKITHALIEGNVRIRDDRGTPAILTDDMNIGPMTHLIFDEGTQQITTNSHVVVQDTEQTTIGDDLLIQMRKKDPKAQASQSSSGFEGAEYLILQKFPRVTLRDVGNSGVMPGSSPTKKSQKEAVVKVQGSGGGPAGKKDQAADAEEPSPLVIMADGPMRIDFPKSPIPVEEGPPEPPAPTRVRFDRNVVALQTHPGRQPDQLNCDNLRLTLVPAEKPPEPKSANPKSAAPGQGAAAATAQPEPATESGPAPVGSVARSNVRRDAVRAEATGGVATRSDVGGEVVGAISGVLSTIDPSAAGSPPSDSGPFGNLTLQKAHATGHAVWLQLREQGLKVLSNELIHERRAPYQPDMTYFRGDTSRGIWLEKIDREPIESEDAKTTMLAQGNRSANPPKQGKITGVTHVMTLDATLYDMGGGGTGGGGLDLSDIVARGPGKLESRPDLKAPVERTAIWQDELTIQNFLGPDSKLALKKITLTGTRPYFVDTVKKASVDSSETIIVKLVPKAAIKKEAGTSTASTQADSGPLAVANAIVDDIQSAGKKTGSDTGDGGLQIKQLVAFPDGHFLAPGKNLKGRLTLEANFVESEPMPLVAATTPARSEAADNPDGTEAAETPAVETPPANEAAIVEGQAPVAVADQGAEPKPSAESKPTAEPTMNGVADRIWAKVALKPGSDLDAASNRRSRTAAKPTGTPGNTAAIVAAGSADAQAPTSGESDTDVREAWLWGNVTLHQESPPDTPENPDGTKAKPKTQDVSGEAVYMDNYRGKGKMLARVYDHNPNEPPRPLPWPLARVATDEKTIRSTLIRMDQEHDKVWCDGPGELTQWTERSLFTDKKEEPQDGADGGTPAPADPGSLANTPASPPGNGNRIRTSTGSSTAAVAQRESAPASKPQTRGGRPITDKDLLTITWTTRMEFTGRSKDPITGQPAGKAEFFGFPNAMMEDAQLKCVERMIVYTDREVPLGELGSISTGTNKPGGGSRASKDGGDGEAKDQSTVDISLIYCFGKSLAVTRKMYPDVMAWIEQNMIYADHRLDYNRRTGEFSVPGKGRVYKYERKNESDKTPTGESTKEPDAITGGTNTGRSTAARRTLTPTSGRTASGAPGAASSDRTTTSAERRSARSTVVGNAAQATQPATPPVSRKIPPLVLTQVFFTKGMQGQFGTGQENDTTQDRTAILFGDIQLRNAQVNSVEEAFDFDQPLTDEGFYLTSQILRLIQEPPLPSAPPGTPTRSFIKAWDNVTVNKGRTMAIQSDVGTYDSGTDVLYAYGEGDRGVEMVEQYAVGQPASPAHGKALQFNVKTGAAHFVNSDVVQLFDKRTGSRPGQVGTPNPNVKKPPRRSTPFMVPNNNLERRGFTAQ